MDLTSSACQIDLSFMGDCAEADMEGEERSLDIRLELTFAGGLEAGGEQRSVGDFLFFPVISNEESTMGDCSGDERECRSA